MRRLEGRVAVVTGAAGGIGLALARRLRSEGMRVVLADVEATALRDAAAALGAGDDVLPVRCDVADDAHVAALAARAMEAFGAVHVLCNNAGVFTGGLVWETPPEDWRWVLGVNLMGAVHGLRHFVPILLGQDEAHVVNVASMAGVTATPLSGVYNVSKHAVVALSETLALDLATRGAAVGVSCVCPEAVRTGIDRSDRNRPDALRAPGSAPSEGREIVHRAITAAVGRGLDPDVVAARVVAAVREGRFWVLADDPDWRAACRRRADALRAAAS
jgi:NAD(P)-dependent dehydrogenase (short-subunit alcohol dehydrogenase family)